MLFKTTILLPAIVALGLATAVPGPEVEDDLVARGPEVEEDLAARGGFIEDDLAARDLEVEDDLAARGGHPDCGQFASWSSQFNRCFCRQPGYIFYPNGKFCSIFTITNDTDVVDDKTTISNMEGAATKRLLPILSGR
ncbi:hypothetical protein TASIC1_0003074700 [Trichoderma asperellum]|uniref:Uncharacterized protein n=1 Tax=Trichoderma asperellum TaxID=101201 RepID=A0A6V8QPB9_TRIAP|nr:hypothetical protein TASIC1_0003074700 [Trichoderma asperellum]